MLKCADLDDLSELDSITDKDESQNVQETEFSASLYEYLSTSLRYFPLSVTTF